MPNTLQTIGKAAVDSGQLLIIDPCYVWGDAISHDESQRLYDEACSLTTDGRTYGEIEGGVVFATAHGDGTYNVHAEVDKHGRVLSITINFDYDEWEDEDDEDDFLSALNIDNEQEDEGW